MQLLRNLYIGCTFIQSNLFITNRFRIQDSQFVSNISNKRNEKETKFCYK